LFSVTPLYLISPIQNRDPIKIPVFPIEEYRDHIYTLTPSRMCFLTWMQKQLAAVLTNSSKQRFTFPEQKSLALDIENPPICMQCGSWHNPQNTPCIPNILTLQQGVPISRQVKFRCPTSEGYIVRVHSILDGGNFKHEAMYNGTTATWSRHWYTHQKVTRVLDMALVLPDAFLLHETILPTPCSRVIPNHWRESKWIQFWYLDPPREEWQMYLETQGNSRVQFPPEYADQLLCARLAASPDVQIPRLESWEPEGYYTILHSRALLAFAVPERWDESMIEVNTDRHSTKYNNRNPLPTPIPFMSC